MPRMEGLSIQEETISMSSVTCVKEDAQPNTCYGKYYK